jgi:hypothetical protein
MKLRNLLLSEIVIPRGAKMDEQAFRIEKDAIRKYGIEEPLLIGEKNGRFIIIDGEDVPRYFAAKELGLTEVPCMIAEPDKFFVWLSQGAKGESICFEDGTLFLSNVMRRDFKQGRKDPVTGEKRHRPMSALKNPEQRLNTDKCYAAMGETDKNDTVLGHVLNFISDARPWFERLGPYMCEMPVQVVLDKVRNHMLHWIKAEYDLEFHYNPWLTICGEYQAGNPQIDVDETKQETIVESIEIPVVVNPLEQFKGRGSDYPDVLVCSRGDAPTIFNRRDEKDLFHAGQKLRRMIKYGSKQDKVRAMDIYTGMLEYYDAHECGRAEAIGFLMQGWKSVDEMEAELEKKKGQCEH